MATFSACGWGNDSQENSNLESVLSYIVPAFWVVYMVATLGGLLGVSTLNTSSQHWDIDDLCKKHSTHCKEDKTAKQDKMINNWIVIFSSGVILI